MLCVNSSQILENSRHTADCCWTEIAYDSSDTHAPTDPYIYRVGIYINNFHSHFGRMILSGLCAKSATGCTEGGRARHNVDSCVRSAQCVCVCGTYIGSTVGEHQRNG